MASHGTCKDLGSSSSEEDCNRADAAEVAAEETRSPVTRHPFSVEALMSRGKTDSHSGDLTRAKSESGSVMMHPAGLGSPYLCRETCSPPGGSRQHLTGVPSSPSPVKSDASELEDCAPWVPSRGLSIQPRKCLLQETLLLVLKTFWILYFHFSSCVRQ